MMQSFPSGFALMKAVALLCGSFNGAITGGGFIPRQGHCRNPSQRAAFPKSWWKFPTIPWEINADVS
jgi:hypothetical protein